MRKFIFMMVLVTLALTACGNTKRADTEKETEQTEETTEKKRFDNKVTKYLERAELTEEEKSILRLAGGIGGMDIYNFYADEKLDNIQINYYEYRNGEWKLISDGSKIELSDSEGRFVLKYGHANDDIEYVVQTDTDGEKYGYVRVDEEDSFDKGSYISDNPNASSINYGEEIVFFVKAIGEADEETPRISRQSFSDTEPLNEYERAFAVTVVFNEKTEEE